MPNKHKYQEHNFGNGFETHNSILDTVPYDPEVIFIGTYNHGWSWNPSDFFYGRGMYMWTILGNLFLNNGNHWTAPRTALNDIPSLETIFNICSKGKIVFADIVKGVNEDVLAIELEGERCVLVDNEYRWESRLIGNKKVGEYSDTHLDNLAASGYLDDNVGAINDYINNTKSIKHVYFTFKSGAWIVEKLNAIRGGIREGVSANPIFSPTGNGFGTNIGFPFNERAWSLAHCWVRNGLGHHVDIDRPGYGHLDHQWLIEAGVNPDHF
ncbi:hypothetical protein ACTJKC_02720 [Pedobacter sp. 22226]|uniref:hypothetical protein n=1 Tax=Pedobacter sp. 22226 TaxID=3453894 RepID=UPI003F85CB7D